MRIIFAGTPDFAASALERIIAESFEICAVYTQPDRPAGRGKKIHTSAVKQVALSHNIAIEQPLSLKDPQALETLREYQPDLMIVAAYGLILPTAVLTLPTYGCVNIHASLLPRWRGAAPIQRAIEAGDSESGITIMQMDEGLDTGDILSLHHTDISPNDTGGSLHDRLADMGAQAISTFVTRLQTGPLSGVPQDDALATYAKKLSKAEALLDWNKPALELARQVRAFNPWPVSYFMLEDRAVRVWEACAIDPLNNPEQSPQPGTILSRNAQGIDIACQSGVLRITRIQVPGAKALAVSDFVNGNQSMMLVDSRV